MSNPTFKPSEGKREEFRKYLEKGGVMDALTKVLVNLYEEPEKPEDALEYIRDRLAMQAGLETYSQMKGRLEEFQTRIDNLTLEVGELRAATEPPPEGDVEGEALIDDGTPVDPIVEGDGGVPGTEDQGEGEQPAAGNPE